MSQSLFAAVERARERFRKDVADQLQLAVVKAGLAAAVGLDSQQAVLEFDAPLADGPPPRVVAAFDEDGALDDRVTLYVETGDGRTALLTVAWRQEPGLDIEAALETRLAELEARTDERLPLQRRGLNAAADLRTGRYAKGDVIRQLAGDLKRAAARAPAAPEQSHALVPIEPRPPALTPRPDRRETTDDGRPPAPEALPAADIETQRANLSELLVSSLIQAMQRDLIEADSDLVGPGVGASVRGRVGRIMEWGMLATAYGVEATTNKIAVGSFLGGGPASWLYGLVGPVLIGGLAYLSRTRFGRGAAYGLMMTWALAMATITASERSYLDRAQAYFPRQAVVLTHEQAVAAARLRKDAAQAELNRLNAPSRETSALLADAKKRWQAAEIKRAAEREGELRDKDRTRARQAVVDAGVALIANELRLREALLNDPSRTWAWGTLFAIFAVINLAGPLAIARVLERWRINSAEAEARAKDGHRKKASAELLRRSRSAQKAHAMQLLQARLDHLPPGKVPQEVIAGLDLGHISQKAADAFDRAVNDRRAARRWFGSRRPGDGPG
jgi:hypothetical protein